MLCGGGRIEGNFDADFLDLHFETGESSGGGFVDIAGVGFDFSDADIGASGELGVTAKEFGSHVAHMFDERVF